MSSTPPNEMNVNPYQSYPNPSVGSGMNPVPSGPGVVGPTSPNLSPHFTGTTTMLSLLALVSLYEATHRVILYSNSYLPWDASDDSFPAAALLVGGVWEAFYALVTLFIALWALLFDFHSVALTTLALGTQFVGWYSVVVFAIAQPAYTTDKFHSVGPGATTGLNQFGIASGKLGSDESKSAYVFGWLLPLFALDTALLAGMIFFTIQLMQIQMNNVSELHSPLYYSRRLSFWALLELFYGVSTIVYAGIFLGENVNEYDQPEYFYPNFTSWGSISMITGILMTLVGLIGLMACGANSLGLSNLFIALSWFTFLWVAGAHVMGQCGFVQNVYNQAAFGMAELGLFFGVLLIGMYLAYKSATIETVHRGNYVVNSQKGRVVV